MCIYIYTHTYHVQAMSIYIYIYISTYTCHTPPQLQIGVSVSLLFPSRPVPSHQCDNDDSFPPPPTSLKEEHLAGSLATLRC